MSSRGRGSDYLTQPRLRALQGTEFDFGRFGACPIEELQQPQRLLLERARLSAVPAREATLTTDGRRLEPKTPDFVGYWPPDQDARRRYLEEANAHIDSLPDTAWLIVVDCHI